MKLRLLMTCMLMTKAKYFDTVRKSGEECEPAYNFLRFAEGKSGKAVDMSEMFALCPKHKVLEEKYSLKAVAGEGSCLDRALAVMQWLTDNTCYCGMQWRRVRDDSVAILKFAYGKGFSRAINCRYKAIALVDCLLAVGIEAMPVLLLGAGTFGGVKSFGCHFMVRVYLRDIGKAIVVDPSFNAYFTDGEGEFLDQRELSDRIRNGENYNICGYIFNGEDRCMDAYKKLFLGCTLEYVCTWKDNSAEKMKNMSAYCVAPQSVELEKELSFLSTAEFVNYDDLDMSGVKRN